MLSKERLLSLTSFVVFVGLSPTGVFAPLPVVFPVETWPICYIGNKIQGTCERIVDCHQAVDTIYKGLHPPACYWQRQQTFPLVCCPEHGTLNEILEPDRRVPIIPLAGVGQQFACGRVDGQQIVTDGTSSNSHVWPWMVSIYKEDQEDVPVGSGFLIDDTHVLTAAHNFPSSPQSNGWQVKLQNPEHDVNGAAILDTIYNVNDIKVHEGYRSWVRYDDLALLTLNQAVPNVHPICLPPSDFDPNSLAGANATILGDHRFEDVPVVSSTWCSEMYTKFLPLTYPRGLDGQFFCAGLQLDDQPSAETPGNMGGPVMTQSADGLWTAVGLVSLDYKTTQQGLPGVYLNLAHYKDWIDQQKTALH